MRRLYYWVENALLRGIGFHLVLVLAVIAFMCFVAAAIVTLSGEITSYLDALWWAFLRLSDPGYLGDDEGIVLRTTGLLLTMLGYVVFLGALVAILTSWMNVRIQQLQQGRSAVVTGDHFLILGWSKQVPAIVRDFALSGERVKRRIGHRRPTIVMLLPEMNPVYVRQIENALGPLKSRLHTVYRAGNPSIPADLERVAVNRANTIILVAADETREQRDTADAHTVKTLVSLSRLQRDETAGNTYAGVAELTHTWNADLINDAAREVQIETLPSDAFVSRIIAQSVRKAGTSAVFAQLFTHGDGPQAYFIRIPDKWHGMPFRTAYHRLAHSLPIGIKTTANEDERAILNPDPDTPLRARDHLIVLSDSLRDADKMLRRPAAIVTTGIEKRLRSTISNAPRHLLILHWNVRIATLLHTLDTYPDEHFHVTVVSSRDAASIYRALARFDSPLRRVTLRVVHGNPAIPQDLADLPWDEFTHVLFAMSDRPHGSAATDTNTLMSYLRLRPRLTDRSVLVEVPDAVNAAYFSGENVHTLITQHIVGHALAQIALRPDLNTIYTQLTSAGSPEIDFVPSLALWSAGETKSFAAITTDVSARRAVALGVRHRGKIHLNPPRTSLWSAGDATEVIVIASP